MEVCAVWQRRDPSKCSVTYAQRIGLSIYFLQFSFQLFSAAFFNVTLTPKFIIISCRTPCWKLNCLNLRFTHTHTHLQFTRQTKWHFLTNMSYAACCCSSCVRDCTKDELDCLRYDYKISVSWLMTSCSKMLGNPLYEFGFKNVPINILHILKVLDRIVAGIPRVDCAKHFLMNAVWFATVVSKMLSLVAFL